MAVQTTEKAKPQQSGNEPRATQLIKLYDHLKGDRQNWETYWQSLHDYFYIEGFDINTWEHPGNEVRSDYLYDSTTMESADVLASGFMNYLTPPTSKWFALRAKDPALRANKKVANYLEQVTDQVNYTLNKSNFYNQMISSYKGSGVYGTSAMLEEEDVEDDARFTNIPIKNLCLVEDARGRPSEYFIEFEYTASQAASRWGKDKLSKAMQDELDEGNRKEVKHPFLLYISNRSRRDVTKTNKENMPVGAVWLDKTNKKTLDEGGYNEFPAFAHRFDKRPSTPWGYSPAMKTLPFARILNSIAKTNLRSMMKHTDPAIVLPENAFIMPLNANPRAVNYYNKTKMDGSKDIFTLGNTGNPQMGLTAIEYYSQQVKSLMYTDVFLAFNNVDKRMNNPEVMERINEKMTLLGPAVGRYISEFLNPVVVRTIGILSRRGKLPPPPDEMINSPEYEIDIISQLAQAQRRSELNSLMTGLQIVGQMAQLVPDVLDKVSPDAIVDETWDILGAPAKVLRDDGEVREIREAKADAMEQQMQMEQMAQSAEVVKSASEIDKNVAESAAKNKQ